MKILILGGTDLTLNLIKTIHENKYNIVGVVSIPKDFSISYNKNSVNAKHAPIEDYCNAHNISHLPYSGDSSDLITYAQMHSADFCLVAGWYYMLSSKFTKLFPMGCAGVHASLLPQLRGVSPLNWAIIKNLKKTGVSLFEISKHMDEGDLFGQTEFPIHSDDTILDLLNKCTEASKKLCLETLESLENNNLQLKKQIGTPSYCCARVPEDSFIKWELYKTQDIHNLVRASTKPYLGAYTYLEGRKITIWDSRIYDEHEIWGAMGQVINISLCPNPLITCKDGVVEIIKAEFDDGDCAMNFLKKSSFKRFGAQ